MRKANQFIRKQLEGDGEGLFSAIRSLARGDRRDGALQTTVFADSAKLFTLVHTSVGTVVEKLPIPTGAMGFTIVNDTSATLYAVDHDPADPAATGVPTPGWVGVAGETSEPHLLPEGASNLHIIATAADAITVRFFGRRSTAGALTFPVWVRNAGGVTSNVAGKPVAAAYVAIAGIAEGSTVDLEVTDISAGNVSSIAKVGLATVTEPVADTVRVAGIDSDLYLTLTYA